MTTNVSKSIYILFDDISKKTHPLTHPRDKWLRVQQLQKRVNERGKKYKDPVIKLNEKKLLLTILKFSFNTKAQSWRQKS